MTSQAQVVHERQVARVEPEREREPDRERERRAEADDRGADVQPERDLVEVKSASTARTLLTEQDGARPRQLGRAIDQALRARAAPRACRCPR